MCNISGGGCSRLCWRSPSDSVRPDASSCAPKPSNEPASHRQCFRNAVSHNVWTSSHKDHFDSHLSRRTSREDGRQFRLALLAGAGALQCSACQNAHMQLVAHAVCHSRTHIARGLGPAFKAVTARRSPSGQAPQAATCYISNTTPKAATHCTRRHSLRYCEMVEPLSLGINQTLFKGFPEVLLASRLWNGPGLLHHSLYQYTRHCRCTRLSICISTYVWSHSWDPLKAVQPSPVILDLPLMLQSSASKAPMKTYGTTTVE